MTRVAAWIDEVVSNVDDEAAIDRVGAEVREYCRRFPAPGCLLG